MAFITYSEIDLEYAKFQTKILSIAESKDLAIKAVKAGRIKIACKVFLNLDQTDPLVVLYKGRLLSQSGNLKEFIEFTSYYKSMLRCSKSLTEDLLPWYWRLGISYAVTNNRTLSARNFDIHKELSSISHHQFAHYDQCYGAYLIASNHSTDLCYNHILAAGQKYFSRMDRDEPYHSQLDNARCIIMNLILQAILDFRNRDKVQCYAKLLYCRYWLKSNNIPKYASGFAELFFMLKEGYEWLLDLVFSEEEDCILFNKSVDSAILFKLSIEINVNYQKHCGSDLKILKRDYQDLLNICNYETKKYYQIHLEGIKLQSKKVFIVQGKNVRLNQGMFAFLTALRLDPIEWEEARKMTGKASPYIGEILDVAFKEAQAIVIMLTGDEEVKLLPEFAGPEDDLSPTRQPRPNVIFEAGASLAIQPERTIIVQFGRQRVWSDLAGRHVVMMDNSMSKRQELANRLMTAGCPIEILSGSAWQIQGDLTP